MLVRSKQWEVGGRIKKSARKSVVRRRDAILKVTDHRLYVSMIYLSNKWRGREFFSGGRWKKLLIKPE